MTEGKKKKVFNPRIEVFNAFKEPFSDTWVWDGTIDLAAACCACTACTACR